MAGFNMSVACWIVLLVSITLNIALPLVFRGYYKDQPNTRDSAVVGVCAGNGEERGRSRLADEELVNMGEAVGDAAHPLQKSNGPTTIACNGDRHATQLSPETVINLDHGDPTMYEAIWKSMGDKATIILQGWQMMSYFSDVGNICWFLEPKFAEEVRRLHRQVGNAIADDKHIVVGTGSSQLFQAALYALVPADAPQPTNVVSAVPYYSSYPAVTDYLQSRLYRWAGDALTYKGDAPYIELVCSPNNPDGASKQAVLQLEMGSTIHDLAYYWPQYTAIKDAANHEIMLFTVSKSTGHAGTRIGWALVKDKEIAKKMTKFIELNTIGVSKDSQLRAAKLLSVVTDNGDEFFQYSRHAMTERWRRLREVVKKTGAFSLPAFPSEYCNYSKELTESHPAFAWMRCEKEGIDDCQSFLKSHKILTRSGIHFGMDPKYVRVSMLDRDPQFDLFIDRLSSIY